MKRPYLHFYPNDWRCDSALKLCSIGARGLWVEILFLMHEFGQQESDRYGYLEMKGKRLDDAQLARLTSVDEKVVSSLLKELESFGVFERDESGTIFSRRFIREAEIMEKRQAAGRKGGKSLQAKIKQVPKQVPKQMPKQKVRQTPRAGAHQRADNDNDNNNNIDVFKKGSLRENENVVSLFNEICVSLPKVLRLNDRRHGLIERRRSEKVDFKELFTLAQASDFLTGREQTSLTFRASFDWLLKSSNCIKTLEGNYVNKTKSNKDRDYANAFG